MGHDGYSDTCTFCNEKFYITNSISVLFMRAVPQVLRKSKKRRSSQQKWFMFIKHHYSPDMVSFLLSIKIRHVNFFKRKKQYLTLKTKSEIKHMATFLFEKEKDSLQSK